MLISGKNGSKLKCAFTTKIAIWQGKFLLNALFFEFFQEFHCLTRHILDVIVFALFLKQLYQLFHSNFVDFSCIHDQFLKGLDVHYLKVL
jgi:hypothetical protein